MTQNTKKWVRRGYFALMTVALIIVAALFILQCVAIYRLGGNPFTRESIAAHFAPIAAPVYVCIGLVVVGFALSPLLPAAPDSAPDRDEVALRRLQAKTNLAACNSALGQAVNKQRRNRQRHRTVTLVLSTVGAAVFLWYALFVNDYPKYDPNSAVIRAMWVMIPCAVVPFAYGVFTAYFCRRSIKAEIGLLRTAPKEAIVGADQAAGGKDYTLWVQSVVLAVAVGCIVYGLLVGGAAEVLAKALKICTECIGLG